MAPTAQWGADAQERFSEEQMVKILREADKSPVAQVAKKPGVAEQTITCGASSS